MCQDGISCKYGEFEEGAHEQFIRDITKIAFKTPSDDEMISMLLSSCSLWSQQRKESDSGSNQLINDPGKLKEGSSRELV